MPLELHIARGTGCVKPALARHCPPTPCWGHLVTGMTLDGHSVINLQGILYKQANIITPHFTELAVDTAA